VYYAVVDWFKIGFNSKAFDDKLLASNGAPVQTDYDVLEQIRISAFGSNRWEDTPEGYSYSLDNLAKANGMKKTGSGSLAPKLWQDGREQEVIDYCLNDCRLTRDLLLLGLEGKLIDPNNGNLLKLAGLEEVSLKNELALIDWSLSPEQKMLVEEESLEQEHSQWWES
jgi:hypothetical protein